MSISCLGIPNKQRKGKRVSVNSKFFSHKKGHWNNRRWDEEGRGRVKISIVYQLTFTFSKSTIETQEKGAKYVQS